MVPNLIRLAVLFAAIASSGIHVFALSSEYIACQLQKDASSSPLTGCPEGTLYVSPTDSRAGFKKVQDAVDSLPKTGAATILIGEGEYFEMVNVSRSDPLTILGQLNPATAYAPAGNASQRNLVHIWSNLHVVAGLNDLQTTTFTVSPPPYSADGNTNFRAYNIDFENRAADYAISQALAVAITASNASFYGCTFASWQDTWYTGFNANTYVTDSIIYGQVDYLFGFGVAWFQNVTLANRASGPITAWQGAEGTKNGAYIADSRIIRSPDATSTAVTKSNCHLGRPWNDHAVSVYLRTYMDESIAPAGFTTWSHEAIIPSSTFYAEFESHGPGGDTSARVSQDHILTAEEAQSYTLEAVFGGTPAWIDFNYQY